MRPARRRGSTLIELALSLPILMLFLLGMVDMGWLFSRQLILLNASREGARLGALGQTSGQIQAAVTTFLQTSGYTPLPTSSDILVDLSNGMAKVTLNSKVPMIFSTFGPSVTLKPSTVMRIE